jgi:multidrug efflux pump subunit AcrA (membrane-fusion protein)
MSVKFMKFQVEYAEEELTQLKKMYKANDLTEETERMILRRQQHWVERIKAWYDSTVLERDYMFKYTLPNREKSYKEDQEKTTLLLDKARKTWGPWLAQKQLTLAKMRRDLDINGDRLAKLKKDRDAMTLTAPMDGVVYHGRFHQGNWSALDSVDSKLLPGNTVQPDRVLVTIVQPKPSEVHVTIDEKEVHLAKADLKGTAKLPAYPDRKVPVHVAKVSPAPIAPGKFAALIRLDGNDADLVPGLACNIKFTAYNKKEALTVPAKCIFDDDDGDVVYVLLPNGKNEMRNVTLGRTDGKDTEILTGLSAGDEVLLERPTAKTKSAN